MSIPTSTPGRTIGGRYALQSTIGAGGMGTVWRAFDQVLRRQVAVKEVLLPPGVPPAERTMLCERTLREARAAASLNVASVVTIYDVVEEDDRPWIVMELLAARSLAEIIRGDGPMPPAVVADVGLQVIAALDAAHQAGILHRDVKPGNILVASDGRATLTDFGVSRTTGDSALTSTGLLLGSPCYISPERARGHEPGPASDLWSLGATLYAAVEGRPPFDLGDALTTLTAIVTDPPEPYRRAAELTEVLSGLLEKDPLKRWDVHRASAGLRWARATAHGGVPLSPEAEHANATRVLDPHRPTPPAAWPTAAAAGRPLPNQPAQDHPAQSQPAQRRPAQDHPGQDHPGQGQPGQGQPAPNRPPANPPTLVQQAPGFGQPPPRWSPNAQQPPHQLQPNRPPVSHQPRSAARRRGRLALVALFSLLALGGATTAAYRFVPPLLHRSGHTIKTPAATGVPAGYRRYSDPAGFTIVVPQGWRQIPNGKSVDFKDPGTRRFLRLTVSRAGGHDVAALLAANDRRQDGTLRGYRKVAIQPVQVAGRPGADWEFTHTVNGNRHVVERSFVVGDRWYEFYLSTPEEQFEQSRHIVATVADSFHNQ